MRNYKSAFHVSALVCFSTCFCFLYVSRSDLYRHVICISLHSLHFSGELFVLVENLPPMLEGFLILMINAYRKDRSELTLTSQLFLRLPIASPSSFKASCLRCVSRSGAKLFVIDDQLSQRCTRQKFFLMCFSYSVQIFEKLQLHQNEKTQSFDFHAFHTSYQCCQFVSVLC